VSCSTYAESSNLWSIGLEMFQRPDGGIYQATIDATAKLCMALCDALAIPAQIDSRSYAETPLPRMEHGAGRLRDNTGGPDVVGIMGHRDNTGERGRGDPGDAIYAELLAAGAEPLDFVSCQDLAAARRPPPASRAQRARRALDGGRVGRPGVDRCRAAPRVCALARRRMTRSAWL
jgi:hypothetical protein